MLWLDDPIEALVDPLMMVVLKMLGQDIAQLLFGGEDQMLKTLFFDRPDEPFRVSVEIRTSRRA